MIVERVSHDAARLAASIVDRRQFEHLQKLRREVIPGGFTLKEFDRTRSIFLHIPKTGGVSVSMALYGSLAGSHTTIAQYQMAFSWRDFNSYFKFCFVRNPWDRLYSAYRFLRKGGMDAEDKAWAGHNLSRFADFEEFVTLWLNRENAMSWIHFKPQHSFMTGRFGNVVKLDFLGRFEHLARDFMYVARRLGVNETLTHENRSDIGQPYQQAYTKRMADIVGEVYKEDIRLFDYTFR